MYAGNRKIKLIIYFENFLYFIIKLPGPFLKNISDCLYRFVLMALDVGQAEQSGSSRRAIGLADERSLWFTCNHASPQTHSNEGPLSQFSADSRHSREFAMLFSRTSRGGLIEFAIGFGRQETS